MITVKAVSPRSPAIAAMIGELDRCQLSLYPREICYLDSPAELCGADVHFVAAYDGREALGCGAVKYARGDCAYGEIKRMFVRREARGRGVSKKILASLELHAIDMQVDALRLETGVRQPEAVGLYARFGFTRRGPFGAYAADPLSVFMEKSLAGKS
ncbi:MAG: GNAT family N-acetyltransferase [Gammaproteobacteria bacterium]